MVLPCKVGGRLYRLEKLGRRLYRSAYPEYEVREFEVDRQFILSGAITIFAHLVLSDGTTTVSYETFSNTSIGKTIFLTREEAEAALEAQKGETA